MFFLWITGVFKWRTVHAYFAIWSAPRPDGHPNSPAYGHLKLPHLN